ncbi:Oxidoreductase FAD/NAD(P)-binding protein [Neofusicoccum parvum]|nr:Oxidoreductase FAD/NAD(P)-binding protein [Neofusicoccum parvum]
MAFRQTIRPLTSNLGAVAAVSIGAGLAYTYYKPKPTVFGSFNPTYLRLESTEDVSHNTKRLRFALPHPTDQTGLPLTSALLTLSWPPGRLLPVARPYTPVSHAADAGHVDLLVKRYPGGAQSTHLHALAPGDSLAFVAALPGFAWTPNRFGRIACVAGGAGVTPVFQLVQGIVRDAADRTRVDVVVGVEAVGDAVMRGELEGLERGAGGRVRVVYAVGRGGVEGMGEGWREGRVTKELLEEVLGERGEEETMVFVCGPPAMEEALTKRGGKNGGKGILEELGYRKDQVYKF